MHATDGDCAAHQAGPMWYVMNSSSTEPVVKQCTVPRGTYLLVAMQSYFCTIWDGAELTEASLTQCTTDGLSSTTHIGLEIDGIAVPGMADVATTEYRSVSSPFGFVLPEDHIIDYANPIPAAGTASVGIDQGFYAIVAPLPSGEHSVRLTHETVGGHHEGHPNDVTYRVVVE